MNFDTIAKRYDRFNLIASFALCLYWKKRLIQTIKGKNKLLDLCAGTGSIALSFLEKNPTASATLLDQSEEMLSIARKRVGARANFLIASAESIPLPNHSFDAIACAYGIRNVNNLDSTFSEAFRITKKGGCFVILELTRPTNFLIAPLHLFYVKKIIPLIGKWVTGEKEPFDYLSETILSFHTPSFIQKKLVKAGFNSVQILPLTGGIATLIVANKKIK